MPNMSYCRFQNTLEDLKDVYQNLEEEISSTDEQEARQQLIELCVSIALDFGDDVNMPVERI